MSVITYKPQLSERQADLEERENRRSTLVRYQESNESKCGCEGPDFYCVLSFIYRESILSRVSGRRTEAALRGAFTPASINSNSWDKMKAVSG
jgi:hypothetical protein